MGKLQNKKDALVLEDFFKKGLVIKEKVDKKEIVKIIRDHKIHEGESSIIVLLRKHPVDYCLANEIKFRKIVKKLGYKVVGTLGIILKGYSLGNLNKKQTLTILNQLLENYKEFRFHPKLIEKVIKKIT